MKINVYVLENHYKKNLFFERKHGKYAQQNSVHNKILGSLNKMINK
jgi:hypothetical protein